MKKQRKYRAVYESIMPPSEDYEITRVQEGLHKHHIFDGPLRPLAEKYGLYVYVRPDDHVISSDSLHEHNTPFRKKLEEAAQLAFEEHFPQLNFMQIFGRNFLENRVFDHDELFGLLYRPKSVGE